MTFSILRESVDFDNFKRVWYNDPVDQSFGSYLSRLGLEVITTVPGYTGEDQFGYKYDCWLKEYRVSKIIFESENHYLAFKLKYF